MDAATVTETVWDRRRQFVVGEFERIALEEFAQRGYRTVTVFEIAEAAGVSARTLFRYFPNKEEFLLAYPRRLMAQTIDAIRGLEPNPKPLQAVWTFVRAAMIDTPPDVELVSLWRQAAVDAPEVVNRLRGERVQGTAEAVADYCARSLEVDASVDPKPRLLAGMYAGFEIAFLESLGQPGATLTELIHAADRSIAALTKVATA